MTNLEFFAMGAVSANFVEEDPYGQSATPGERAQPTATVPELWAQPVRAGNSVRQLLVAAMTALLQDSPTGCDTLDGRALTGVYGSWPLLNGAV